MDGDTRLAEAFEARRGHLRMVAYRILGSTAEADDAVQEAWLRLSRTGVESIQNLAGWLTTVVGRVCLDMLRARKSRREEALEDGQSEVPDSSPMHLADHDVALGDAVGVALLLVLDTLDPPERVAFVLHDVFDLPFDEIGPIVGRTPAAARQMASRARRRLRVSSATGPVDRERRRAIVDAFLAASREGNFEALLATLDPEVVLRADPAAVQASAARRAHGAPELEAEMRGAALVARAFSGRAAGAEPAVIDGQPGAVWAPGGQTRAAFLFSVAGSRIVRIEIVVDPARLEAMQVTRN